MSPKSKYLAEKAVPSHSGLCCFSERERERACSLHLPSADRAAARGLPLHPPHAVPFPESSCSWLRWPGQHWLPCTPSGARPAGAAPRPLTSGAGAGAGPAASSPAASGSSWPAPCTSAPPRVLLGETEVGQGSPTDHSRAAQLQVCLATAISHGEANPRASSRDRQGPGWMGGRWASWNLQDGLLAKESNQIHPENE